MAAAKLPDVGQDIERNDVAQRDVGHDVKRWSAARVGPAYIGYTDRKHFRPVSLGTARWLTDDDEEAVHALRENCAVEEWEHGGSESRPTEMVGAFKGHELAALASYQIWGEKIAHIGPS